MAKIGQVGIGAYIPAQAKKDGDDKKTSLRGSAKAGKARFHNLMDAGDVSGERFPIEAARLGALEKPEALEELIDHLFESGEELKRAPIETNFEEYKKNVRILINYVSHKSYHVEKVDGVINPRTFKQKQYVSLELVNAKLDNLAVYILSRQKDQMELLRRVDEINGLIINVVR